MLFMLNQLYIPEIDSHGYDMFGCLMLPYSSVMIFSDSFFSRCFRFWVVSVVLYFSEFATLSFAFSNLLLMPSVFCISDITFFTSRGLK